MNVCCFPLRCKLFQRLTLSIAKKTYLNDWICLTSVDIASSANLTSSVRERSSPLLNCLFNKLSKLSSFKPHIMRLIFQPLDHFCSCPLNSLQIHWHSSWSMETKIQFQYQSQCCCVYKITYFCLLTFLPSPPLFSSSSIWPRITLTFLNKILPWAPCRGN